MPCRQVSTFNGVPASSGSYATEADCLNACKEGACCEGTTCSVKPQCQCQGTGKTFKGVGTTCTPNPCSRCGCDSGLINANTITLSISGAALARFATTPTAFGHEQMREGGQCVNDSAIIDWLNGIAVPLAFTTDPITGDQFWSGQASTASHLSSVLVQCRLRIGCNGSASLDVTYCPDAGNSQTCMRYWAHNNAVYFTVSNPCEALTSSVGHLFGQANATYSSIGPLSCRFGPGGEVATRLFSITYTLTGNPLP